MGTFVGPKGGAMAPCLHPLEPPLLRLSIDTLRPTEGPTGQQTVFQNNRGPYYAVMGPSQAYQGSLKPEESGPSDAPNVHKSVLGQ